ncbi:MAG: hypothetical protein AB7D92_06550 [Sphaerochaeta sp.]
MAIMLIPDTSFEEVEGSMAERTTLFPEQNTEDKKMYFTVLDEWSKLIGSISCETSLSTQLQQTAYAFPCKHGSFTRVDREWAEKQIRSSVSP